MAPKVSDTHLEARRLQILMAAHKCFGRKGFQATTMQELCAEAGLSPGAVYRYFPGKEQIIEGLCELGQQNLAVLVASARRPGSPRQAIGDAVALALEHMEAPHTVKSLRVDIGLWVEAFHAERLNRLILDAEGEDARAVGEILLGGETEDRRRKDRAIALGRIFLALIQGFAVQKALDPALDLEPLRRALLELFTDGDGAPPAGTRRRTVTRRKPRPRTKSASSKSTPRKSATRRTPAGRGPTGGRDAR